MPNNNNTKQPTKPWLRQPKETGRAYKWYTYYRDMGPERTLQKTLHAILNDINKKQNTDTTPTEKRRILPNMSNLKNLSSIHKWVKRSIAYDNWCDEQRLLAKEAMYIEEEQKYIETMQDLREGISELILELQNDEKSRETSKAHAYKSVSQAMDTTLKDLRLITGKSTENSATNVTAEVDQTNTIDGKIDVDVHQTLTDNKFHDTELEFMKELIKKE
jgi:hypothetical protein